MEHVCAGVARVLRPGSPFIVESSSLMAFRAFLPQLPLPAGRGPAQRLPHPAPRASSPPARAASSSRTPTGPKMTTCAPWRTRAWPWLLSATPGRATRRPGPPTRPRFRRPSSSRHSKPLAPADARHGGCAPRTAAPGSRPTSCAPGKIHARTCPRATHRSGLASRRSSRRLIHRAMAGPGRVGRRTTAAGPVTASRERSSSNTSSHLTVTRNHATQPRYVTVLDERPTSLRPDIADSALGDCQVQVSRAAPRRCRAARGREPVAHPVGFLRGGTARP